MAHSIAQVTKVARFGDWSTGTSYGDAGTSYGVTGPSYKINRYGHPCGCGPEPP